MTASTEGRNGLRNSLLQLSGKLALLGVLKGRAFLWRRNFLKLCRLLHMKALWCIKLSRGIGKRLLRRKRCRQRWQLMRDGCRLAARIQPVSQPGRVKRHQRRSDGCRSNDWHSGSSRRRHCGFGRRGVLDLSLQAK